jgi:hypothetical protein
LAISENHERKKHLRLHSGLERVQSTSGEQAYVCVRERVWTQLYAYRLAGNAQVDMYE